LNGTYQLLVYADVTLLGRNINATKRNREILFDASKEVDKEINTENFKFFHHQNAGEIHNIKIINKSFENVKSYSILI
jgi:hypothetical protein